ncbi:MAG: CRISPR-associated helicase/endonuclease Cas3 [Armatimonadota bacterium]|nr:MAG: CRISPR-associated helicase/endonuclease Cas3 [Armatimonadota bacterium]
MTPGLTDFQECYAHSQNPCGHAQPLKDHLQGVAELAAQFASVFNAGEEACLAAALHDAGKLGEPFQRRLQGQSAAVDHWSPGAWAALKRFRSVAAAVAVQGHHQGLKEISKDALARLDPTKWEQTHPQGPRLSVSDTTAMLECLTAAGLLPPYSPPSIYGSSIQQTVSAMLDVRMLFSALVDADFLDTERHFKCGQARPHAPDLQPERALDAVLQHVEHLQSNTNADAEVLRARAELMTACLEAADRASSAGVFTLTAPTGSGKTLAMLAFALKLAIRTGSRRLIFVLPYLSIIDQNVSVYRRILEPVFGQGYIIEHHTLTGTRAAEAQETDSVDEKVRRERLLAENWDAPVILTTSVQFLESLFSNRPGACRKLHRIASSIVLFDEVQTLPVSLTIPSLKALSRLTAGYNTSIVMATATQPAFEALAEHVQEDRNCGWQPVEITPSRLNLFNRLRRTRVRWPGQTAIGWDELADKLKAHPRVLCVVNLKRHAYELVRRLREAGAADARHLSTNLCPAHRQKVLEEVQQALENGRVECRLVSTQCVEAGVDLDFPIVFRAMGPMESIAQAAGRCNRNGLLGDGGVVEVFRPEDNAYPPGGYQQAAAVTEALLNRLGPDGLDLNDPELFRRYFRELYDLSRPESHCPDLQDAIKRQDFETVAREFRLIADDAINVLVPYDLKEFERLRTEVEETGLTAKWLRRARPHSVSVFRPRPRDPILRYLKPVPCGEGR